MALRWGCRSAITSQLSHGPTFSSLTQYIRNTGPVPTQRFGSGGEVEIQLMGVVLCLPRAGRPHQPAVPQHHGALGAGAVDAAPRRHHGLQADSRAHQGRPAPHLQRGTLCHQVPAEEPAAWHRVHRVPRGGQRRPAEQQGDRGLHHL